ncbi:MAG: hypothetical protein ACPGSC_12945, partial [Granulosicoccaceae bacterium]
MKKTIILLIISCCCSAGAYANSLAGLSVSPTRVILSEAKRSAAITLRNTSNAYSSYRLNFVEMGIDENSQVVPMPISEQPEGFKSLSPYARFSPRQVKL